MSNRTLGLKVMKIFKRLRRKKRRTRRTYKLARTFETADQLKEYVDRKDSQLSFKEEITDVNGGRTVHYRCGN